MRIKLRGPVSRHTAAASVVGALALLASSFPAAAQSSNGAVVCVASELETIRSSAPVRRVVRRDVEVIYRVGVNPAGREALEETLLSELGDYPEGWCAWSGPADSHVVIVRYTGVIRGDAVIDPDDPRFQGLAVGYGGSAESAEADATRADDRFSAYYDGDGYDVLVSETWGLGGAGIPPEAPPVSVRDGAADPASLAPTPPSLSPGDVFSDCDACPQMVVVPAGTFMMGSPASDERLPAAEVLALDRQDRERPQHPVTIAAPFAVGIHEVTFAEWDACVRTGGCGYTPADEGWGRGTRPVINVNWDDAQAYVSWLSQQTGQRYRLLSEAEWEYVARAGTVTARYWGEGESDQCHYANGYGYGSSAPCPDGYEYSAPVGSFAPNAFGLYDVLGNVWEWTQDCWNVSYAGAPADGRAWESGDCSRSVLRGGSWGNIPRHLRSALRIRDAADIRDNSYGFRVARTLN